MRDGGGQVRLGEIRRTGAHAAGAVDSEAGWERVGNGLGAGWEQRTSSGTVRRPHPDSASEPPPLLAAWRAAAAAIAACQAPGPQKNDAERPGFENM